MQVTSNGDSVTGVAHACGHHTQMAAMIGCAIALADPEIQKELGGSLSFLAVPAEEYIDADKRALCLRQEGIEFCCGKSEMIRTGVFDDTDIADDPYAYGSVEEDFYLGNPACNGYSAERVTVEARPHTGRSIRGTVSTPSASRPARSR